jgi:hypothetical protein
MGFAGVGGADALLLPARVGAIARADMRDGPLGDGLEAGEAAEEVAFLHVVASELADELADEVADEEVLAISPRE